MRMTSARKSLLAIAVALMAAVGAAPAVELSIDPAYPVQGKEAHITVSHDGQPVVGDTVRVTYRPNSEVLREAEVGMTDASGRLIWVPEDAGLAQLSVTTAEGSASRAVSIRFSSPPALGLVILLIAGLILFGGNIRFVLRTLKARG